MAKKKTLHEKLHEQWLQDKGLKKTKSYNHKPHLKELPYDRRSTSKEELTERFNACREKFFEKTKEASELTNKIDDAKKKINENIAKDKEISNQINDNANNLKAFNELSEQALKEKQEIFDSLLKRASELGLPDREFERIRRLDNLLLAGLINDSTAEEFNNVAGRLIDYRYDVTGDDTSWAKQVDGVADDLRMISQNSKELTDAGSKLLPREEVEKLNKARDDIYDEVCKTEDDYRGMRKQRNTAWAEAKDYYGEGENTYQRMRDLGLI